MYTTKQKGYFTAARTDIIQLLPQRPNNRILEVGAGTGETLKEAKRLGLAQEVVGIELVKIDDQISPEIDEFIVGNIETLELDFEREYFNAILCADVLEHLVNPSSIPNIRNYRVMRSILLSGDFEYQDAGILDRTHLSFFCRKNIIEMFEELGYEIVKVNLNMGGYGIKHKIIDHMTMGLLKDLFVFQYCTVARKK